MTLKDYFHSLTLNYCRWTLIRDVELVTADGLAPIPVFMSWVRDGLLVVGFENETHVYSQWRGDVLINTQPVTILPSSSSLMSLTKDNRQKKDSKKSKSPQILNDVGLFEEARRAHPVLPQYHPRQLLELLNFGRIRRVKAILCHLVNCLTTRPTSYHETGRTRSFSRTVSVAETEEFQTAENAVDESAVPPLPIYSLLSVDSSKNLEPNPLSPAQTVATSGDDYDALFKTPTTFDFDHKDDDEEDEDETFTDEVTGSQEFFRRRKRSLSTGSSSAHWGPSQTKQLQRHLIHTRLPGLSSVDQMYLLALADTVATTRADFGANRSADMALQGN